MLLQISIKNFALIENITMDFGSGFNVLTGETGAGKSILIDAINYVLGSKFNKDLIRYGKEKTYVEAIFEVNNEKLKNILLEYNIDYEEVIILSRETFQNGRSIAKVNGKSLVLNNIKKISNCLIDIHGQHQNQGLLDSGTHINYLDSFGDDIFKNQILEFNKNFSEYKNIIHKIDNINGKYDEKDKIVDYLKFQINEINKANLKEDEEEKLTLSYQQQTNASEVSTMLKECNNLLFESLENQSIYDGLNLVIKKLKIIQKYYPKMDSILNDIEGFYYNLQDVSLSFNDMFNEISYDENELNSINERLYLIENLKKKYGFSVKDVIENGKRLEEQINEINN
ncbi:MAG: AAA family ATPase, partial [Clostridiaceae bacterium]